MTKVLLFVKRNVPRTARRSRDPNAETVEESSSVGHEREDGDMGLVVKCDAKADVREEEEKAGEMRCIVCSKGDIDDSAWNDETWHLCALHKFC